MNISRELAIKILKYLDMHKNFYFPFLVMRQEYSLEDCDFVEVGTDEWKAIEKDDRYQKFQLWENLQNLDERTIKLMARGFIEEITRESLEGQLRGLVRNLKKIWKEDCWEGVGSDELALNELIGGKIEAFEECLSFMELRRR